MSKQFDLVVIGAGPGGYVAAIRAAQLGLSVACVDAAENAKGGPAPGGTCTNVGCIPSKALLQSSEHFEQANHHFAEHGIEVKGVSLKLDKLIGRKNEVVKQNNEGILYLFKKNKVTFFHGHAAFAGQVEGGWSINVTGKTEENLVARHVIVATGSAPRELPGVPFDEKIVLSNDGALSLDAVPGKLGVIGAGVIGLEMGSVWRRLGSAVTVLEAAPEFLAAADQQVAKEALKAFTKQGLDIQVGVQISEIKPSAKKVDISYKNAAGEEQKLTVDRLIVSIGRVPFTAGLNAPAVGLTLDERGFVAVDAECRTNLPNVWAVGDVVRGPMLAHKAEEEGVAVAERIAGQHGHVNFATIPWVIYTSPEIAWVGQTEQQLKKEGRAYKAGSFPFLANGRARALGDTTGFVKVLADAKTDEVLGVHIVGPVASELIAEAVTIMEFRGAAEDIARICHAHPTLSEAMKEAALAVDKRALNF
ncbi:dihydrolipoyl dehydrogenase [Kerstersia gyiorum]|uniref:Dihydrolipoyl dehydrogenase n=1 Tax=Kerstersia gyiorum TaxID=206506 RepID=A0A171KSP3_9BURK|nr:dihydrolipoyl dehydrogenase [Kerstersia gyiorum]MCO7638468.1 dihydrolipoyl dehydrogenase [Pseudomonas sp. S 311-6]KAB0542039.1 dihydrolipoyl dehydrogenase [Kerstersia gyiorum]KKO71910.1 dihydrolipoamide dehydrogenase [Kerstersia gyiorum]MCP1633519.1 dihydrolipoamide dehydrogenase [Kerstersia gyiorum]MCP1637226.1 dihydrolipoamide dehydrogenase [Kerstersia gyiorum]